MLCGHWWSSVAVVVGALFIFAQSTATVVSREQRRAAYEIPTEGQQMVFNCSQEGIESVDYWILPDGTVLYVDRPPVDRNYQIGKHGELIVVAVKPGMDGTYACEQKAGDGTVWRIEFLIPYIITNVDYTHSFIISLSLSLAFAGACIIIIIVDKYRWRAKEQRMRKRTRTARKSRVSEMEHSPGTSSFARPVGHANPAFSYDVNASTSITTGL